MVAALLIRLLLRPCVCVEVGAVAVEVVVRVGAPIVGVVGVGVVGLALTRVVVGVVVSWW